MKPSFALSLSFDGIRLLNRAAGGWRVVGDAALDATDLGAELAALRAKAIGLDIGALRTKLLLPNEQIKYLSIETPGMDDSARREAAIKALDGATPYAVADLAWDISADGDVTHIAAVARETLDEAEAFATEHQFNPVSFAAIPGDLPYLGEPYFGPTKAATGLLAPDETVEADGIAVVVIGDLETPAEAAAASPQSSAAAERDPEPAAAAPAADAPATKEEAPPAPAEAPTLSSRTEPDAETASPTPTVGFASRRRDTKAKTPSLGGATRTTPPLPSAAPAKEEPKEPALLGQADVGAGQIAVEPETPSFVPAPEPEPAPPPPRGGFLSRRRAKSPTTETTPPATQPRVIPAAPAPITETDGSEQQRMTIFGARKSEAVGGKPRFLGLILTAALLVFLAGVAAWASVFLDDGLNLSRLFGPREPEVQFSDKPVTAPPQTPSTAPAAEPEIITASLDPVLSDEDTAVLDALRAPAQPAVPPPLSETELEARYAATGIWPVAPVVPQEPAGQIDLEDLYLTSIDPVSTASDAIALPPATGFETDAALAVVANPPAAGTEFALDENGRVIPTAQGALSPDGFTVFLGPPPITPPVTPTRFQSAPQDTAIRSALAALRPQPRPSDLVENSERAQLDGLTRTELAGFRPALRPQSLQEQAEAAAQPAPEPDTAVAPEATNGAVALALAAPDPFETATRFATRASVRPDPRPRNFARIVQRAERAKPAEEVRVASAAAVAPRAVQPKIPSKASVAKQATVKNAINLRKINLIGVYGKPSSRRALVRLDNGRYRKVVVGDRLDGGRVSAIGDSELRYTKRGRDLVLKMPR